MHDRNIDDADEREKRRGARSLALVVDRRIQANHAKIEKQ